MRYCRLFRLKLLNLCQKSGPILGRNGQEMGARMAYPRSPPTLSHITWYSDQGHPTDPIRWGEAVRLEPLGPDSGALSEGGNQAFSAGPALGSGVPRRTASPNGPHIPHPHCLGRALQLLSYKQPRKPARTASKTRRPEAVFRGTCCRNWAGCRPFLRKF